MTSIPELEAQKRKVHETFSKADAALHSEKITKEQRDAILNHYYDTANEQEVISRLNARIDDLKEDNRPLNKVTILVVAFSLLMISFFGILFYSTGGVTGAVILDPNTTFTADSTIALTLESITRVNVSGTISGLGDVTITLVENGESHLLYERVHPQTAHASLAKDTYLLGEPVIYTAVNVSSAYLMTASEAIPLDNDTITDLGVGTYAIKLIINDTELTQETLSFAVVSDVPPETIAFNTCGTLCATNLTGNATLSMTINGASVTLEHITLSEIANSAPLLTNTIPDLEGVENVSVALSFTDPDGDELLYESSHHDGMSEWIENSTFFASGTPGTYTYMIYASDLHEIVPSNIFSVTILGANASLNITETLNVTSNETINITLNITENLTNVTGNMTLNMTELNASCAASDPNQRPIECLQNTAENYFFNEVFLEDINRQKVGRLTDLGNLAIRGRGIQDSTATPPGDVWRIGYDDENFQFVPTIWIDHEGNLHTRGRIVEENTQLVPPSGSYSVINRKGVYLAYADIQTGDLYLRGNLIMYREVIG